MRLELTRVGLLVELANITPPKAPQHRNTEKKKENGKNPLKYPKFMRRDT